MSKKSKQSRAKKECLKKYYFLYKILNFDAYETIGCANTIVAAHILFSVMPYLFSRDTGMNEWMPRICEKIDYQNICLILSQIFSFVVPFHFHLYSLHDICEFIFQIQKIKKKLYINIVCYMLLSVELLRAFLCGKCVGIRWFILLAFSR